MFKNSNCIYLVEFFSKHKILFHKAGFWKQNKNLWKVNDITISISFSLSLWKASWRFNIDLDYLTKGWIIISWNMYLSGALQMECDQELLISLASHSVCQMTDIEYSCGYVTVEPAIWTCSPQGHFLMREYR